MDLSAVALKLLTNILFHAVWLIRRVKAKNAITLELNLIYIQNQPLTPCHCEEQSDVTIQNRAV